MISSPFSFKRRWVCTTLVFTFLFAAAQISAAERLLAICGAYPPEMDALRQEFGVSEANGFKRSVINGVEFWRGQYAGKEVIIFRTGVSLVNAAYQLQLALDHFPISHVFFAGVAGGIDPSLHVGDVVVPDRWAYHSEAAYLNDDGKGGYVKPSYLTTRYPNFGMIFPDDVHVVREGHEQPVETASFAADASLLATARAAVKKVPPMKKAGREIAVSVGGMGVSGTVFLDNAKYREWVFATWKARCLDMESTALAHVAYANGKPFLIVRGLSDLAGGQPGPNPIEANEARVSEIAARVLRVVIEELGTAP